jgi:hypothetical protein
MSEAPREEPEWVEAMRAAGYNIRVGTVGEPMSEIPEVMFDPPFTLRQRIRLRIASVLRSVFRLQPAAGRATHAPLP